MCDGGAIEGVGSRTRAIFVNLLMIARRIGERIDLSLVDLYPRAHEHFFANFRRHWFNAACCDMVLNLN